jgi:septum formation protein
MKLILASASPRRAEILRNAGIAFEARPPRFDESFHPGESPADYVRRLALGKARAAADAQIHSGEYLYIGADTVVVAGGEILGKPSSVDDAHRMLRLLSGRTHEVHTGIALVRRPGEMEGDVREITRVMFDTLSDEEIEAYIATGEPLDKAGAYAIQGIGGRYVTRIEGCYFNVMGLPLARLWRFLREFGWSESESTQGQEKGNSGRAAAG